jgi:enoyl-CoA hydratase/carnithine racemase
MVTRTSEEMPMDFQFLKTEVRDEIAIIEMDRKRDINALSYGMLDEIHKAVSHFIRKEDDTRVIIFTGGDECFSAGIDLKEAPHFSPGDAAKYFRLAVEVYSLLLDQDKILITAVSGIAFGGGFNLALMGDIIYASESAIFGHPEIKYGFNPLLAPLLSRIGLARTKELALRGDPIGAKEAYQIGLVNRVVEPERFRDEVYSCAKQLVSRSPDVVRAVKRSLDVVSRLDAKAALEYELEMTAMLFNIRGDVRDKMKGVIKFKG